MNKVDIQYFALLREERGMEKESLTTDCKTLGDLYLYLKDKHHFSLPLDMIQVAVNDEFSHLHHEITDGIRVVFIPPVAGG